jgi:hypothetical protein
LVGAIGFEPTTPTMSRWCSNQLSYAPEEAGIILSSAWHCKGLLVAYKVSRCESSIGV